MRRLSVSWILSLLLVFAQHGAVLHELGHLSHSQHSSGAALRADLQPSDGGLCSTCEAFAQIASPVGGASNSPSVCPARSLPIPNPCFAIIGADAPTARSRGPPQV